MLTFIGAIFIVIAFAFLIDLFGLVEKSMNVVKVSKNALDVITSSTLNDDAKENAMQAYAKSLGVLFILITLGISFALLAPIGVVFGLDNAGILSFEAVINFLLSWQMIIGGTVLVVAIIWLRGRTKNEN